MLQREETNVGKGNKNVSEGSNLIYFLPLQREVIQ